MKRVRLVSLVAAIVVTTIQWAAFFSPVLYTRSARAVGAAVADDVSGGELPGDRCYGTSSVMTSADPRRWDEQLRWLGIDLDA
jgi:hypothetical protein